MSDQKAIIRAAGVMGAATFISRILGLVREQVFAYLFGASVAMDAYNIAFRIPNLLRDLFAEGAMSAALVPTFVRIRTEQGDRKAWRLAGLVFRVLFIFISILTGIGILFAPQLVHIYAPAFKEVSGKFELTVSLTQILFPFFPFVALAAAFMGILNACNVFFMPAFASALFNATSIVVGVAMAYAAPWFNLHPIEGMSIGVVAGGIIQAFCQLPMLYKVGYRYPARQVDVDPVWYREPGLSRMIGMMVPGMLGLAATQINLLVNSILATSEGTGAVSWLNYAFRLMHFPIGVFGVSLAAATLPQVSRLWVKKDYRDLEESLKSTLGKVIAINLPAAAGLIGLGIPIIRLIFEYGRFTPEDTISTALALAMYSTGLVAYSAVKVLVPACYGMGNTRIAVVSSLVSVGSNIALNLLMVRSFGFWGLALGTSAAAVINMLFLLIAIRIHLRNAGGEFALAPIFKKFAVHLCVAVGMGIFVYTCHFGIEHLQIEPWIRSHFGTLAILVWRLFSVGILMSLGIGFVIVWAQVFKLEDTLEIISVFSKKIKNKLSRGTA